MSLFGKQPVTPLPFLSGHGGGGSIAVNADGTLFASAHYSAHAVYIYSTNEKGERVGDVVVVGRPGVSGDVVGLLTYPEELCFVHRRKVDTLLISTRRNGRIVEVSASGMYLRDIHVPSIHGLMLNSPIKVAFSAERDMLALTSLAMRLPVCVHYESCAVAVTLDAFAYSAAFALDGEHLIVADAGTVRKCSASTGKYIECLAARGDGVYWPGDVVVDNEGNIIVMSSGSLLYIASDGTIFTHRFTDYGSHFMSFSSLLNGIVIKDVILGTIFLVPYEHAWSRSSRGAWVAACSL